MNDERKLAEVLEGVYESRRHEVRVNPAWLATEALQRLDPDRVSPDMVYRAAHLQLRQIARTICRRKWQPETGGVKEQDDLFPDLQLRYPAAHSASAEEPEYVLRDHLTEADVMFNYNRLYAEAHAKMEHADALLAWWRGRPRSAA